MNDRDRRPRPCAAPWWVRLSVFLLLIGVTLGWLRGCVAGQFFYPDRRQHVWKDPGLPYEDVFFHAADGTKLHGWFVPAVGEARGTVVHMHGNAQNITVHYGFVDWLPARGYNVFAFDYRGYGKSDGSPTISGCVADGLAAIEYVHGRAADGDGRIVVLGQSLGAAVATAVVGREQPDGVRGVFLDSGFVSYPRIVGEKMRETVVLFPLSFLAPLLVDDEYSPDLYIARIAPRRVLFLHGTADRTIPSAHSETLHELAGEPKSLHLAAGSGHLEALDFQRNTWRPVLLEFLERSFTDGADP